MRLNLAMFLLAAGTVAGCSSNTMAPAAAPAPMAMAPEPAPAPMAAPMMSSVDGLYRGNSETAGTYHRGCARPGAVSTSIRHNVFVLKGIRARVGADGSVRNISRRGGMITGTVSNGSLDVTTKSGRCSYHIVATHA